MHFIWAGVSSCSRARVKTGTYLGRRFVEYKEQNAAILGIAILNQDAQ